MSVRKATVVVPVASSLRAHYQTRPQQCEQSQRPTNTKLHHTHSTTFPSYHMCQHFWFADICHANINIAI